MMKRYPTENEDDNIEYKRYLLDRKKFWGYSTQMNARLIQGKEICGIEEAHYFIGLDDEGTVACISDEQLEISDEYFGDLCKEVNAKIISKEVQCFDEGTVLKYHIKRIHNPKLEDIKLALLGESGVGKSTIISVLTHDELDDGKGTAKKEIFRHLHEIKSGLTSSITYGIIGIKKDSIVNFKSNRNSWDKVANISEKIIKLIDLPGDEKFEKTTLFGLLAHCPDIVGITFSFDTEINPRIINFISVVKGLGKKIFFLLNKSDLKEKIGAETYVKKINEIHKLDNTIPLITANTTNHDGLDSLKDYILKFKFNKETEVEKEEEPTIFMINEIFNVPEMGTVLHGHVKSGKIKIDSKLMIGPFENSYHEVKVKSIHNEYRQCEILEKGYSGTILIKKKISFRKNSLLFSQKLIPKFKKEFYIKVNSELMDKINPSTDLNLFLENINETVKVIEIDKEANIIKVRFLKDDFRYLISKKKALIKYLDKIWIVNIIS